MANIITLTGPAHCGKSMVCDMFIEFKGEGFRPVSIPKYTTREQRTKEKDVKCVDKIPSECDLVYEQYGVRYGVSLESLYQKLEEGYTPIIVLNDIRAVEDLKAILGSMVYSIFIYRKPAVLEEFLKEEKERAAVNLDNSDIIQIAKTRYEKAQAIYRIYIENIHLFDRVILNISETEKARVQVKCIAESLQCQLKGLKEVHMNG